MTLGVGLSALAIGFILVTCWRRRPRLDIKPQPREDFTPLFDLQEAAPVRKRVKSEIARSEYGKALKAQSDVDTSGELVVKVLRRKRDPRTGRFI